MVNPRNDSGALRCLASFTDAPKRATAVISNPLNWAAERAYI